MSLCPRTRGTHHSNQLTQSTSHEVEEHVRRRLWGRKKTNKELVHTTVSMGGKCMLNNNGQSQYAQYDARP